MDLGEGVHFHPLFLVVAPALILLPSLVAPWPPDNCFQRKKKRRNQKKNHGPRGQKTDTRSSAYAYSFFFPPGVASRGG